MDKKQRISDAIRNFRKSKELTQQQFANALNTTKSTISHWENATHLPDLDMALKIADTFNVPISLILGEISQEEYNLILKYRKEK